MSGQGSIPAQPCSEWKYNPIYVSAHPEVTTKAYKPGESLPLGKVIEFETEIFVGKALIRIRGIPSETPEDDEAYFDGKKRLFQLSVQGKFKENINLGELVMGDFYEKPMKNIPKGPIMKIYQKLMESITPGIVMDLISDKPKVLANFGNIQTLRVDLPGKEPDISVLNSIKEDTSLLITDTKDVLSTPKRRKYLGKLKNSSKYITNSNHVYTFEAYDQGIDLAGYCQKMPFYTIDFVNSQNGQALALASFTRNRRPVFKFLIWHERLIRDIIRQQEEDTRD
mmetsp:Transcript_7927/g.12139  ORF Transcript_7927/g.12139 Transcript_7927/m.12139 type:complete len:282 (+) Transcript_7927:236-1081(+)|eukprot:CAMPEP_0178899416 /NCGR_PEP_ID=MMETSP0786-20121207/2888_1 /TAXON_ID=186022 /ORGANISM="Thalassionema frauenfeldii, Strain CCMP 1798" /LENGTH=281 /DNA_ID=CAMNT_0020570271 /DNA_START=196 /DNA_END=1041 /DNA_ORIENTATION=-